MGGADDFSDDSERPTLLIRYNKTSHIAAKRLKFWKEQGGTLNNLFNLEIIQIVHPVSFRWIGLIPVLPSFLFSP